MIAAVPFLLSAVLGWFWLRPQIIADTEESQRQLASVIASRTEDYLVASSREISRTAAIFSRKLIGSDNIQEYLDTVLASSANLTSLTLTDGKGRVSALALTGDRALQQQEMVGIDLSLTDAVRQVRSSGKHAWSDVYLSPVGGGLTVAYATPSGEGVALGEISLSRLNSFLKGITEQERQIVFILDRHGQVIADREGHYTARQFNLTNLDIVGKGLASGMPVTGSFSFNGDRFVGCMIRASFLDWNILVASPVQLAYRSALTTSGIFASALCLALLMASGMSFFMSSSLASRFENLVSHARRIESGEEKGDWPKASIREFNFLAEALHSMAESLRERERRLNEQVDFLQQLIDSIPVPVYYKDVRGAYLGCNAAFETLLGLRRRDIVGKTVYELLPKDRADLHHAADTTLLCEPGVQRYEVSGIYDDSFRYVLFNKATFVDRENRVAGIVGAALDITERKHAEDALRESEEKFRVLAETSPAAIILQQGERCIYTNPATTRISGYSETELREMNFREWCGIDACEPVREGSHTQGNGEPAPTQYEQRVRTRDGREKWVLVSVGATEYQGRLTDIATLLDITEKKIAEEGIKVALAEKILLLKEVHHRVKNNLQIISSLLDLQSDSIPDEQSRRYLRESQNRVRSMALIHERLYASGSLSTIDFGDYITDLTQYLFSSYAVDRKRISLHIQAGDCTLDIDRAIPCGLIVNELISNALKHAFPCAERGNIDVIVSVDEKEMVTLTVSDTGIGLPAGLDIRKTHSLGLQLVEMLVRQLRGRIRMESTQNGAVFSLVFPGSSQNLP